MTKENKKDINTSVSVRISAEEKQALQERAHEEDLTMSQIIRKAIKEFLNK